MLRYIIMVWDQSDSKSCHAAHALTASVASDPLLWNIAHKDPGSLAMYSNAHRRESPVCMLGDNKGVVLGTLFDRHGDHSDPKQCLNFSDVDTHSIVSSRGKHLVEKFWGSYVSLIYDSADRSHHVFRDPTGNLPCYHTSYSGTDIFFSHIDDCIRYVPLLPTVNRRYLSQWLIGGRMATRESGLAAVDDVPAGERQTVCHQRLTRTLLWRPVEIAQSLRIEQTDEAARQLRFVVQNTINAWASCYRIISHKLSGGLDSSIVAGCLAQAPSRPTMNFLNFSIDVGYDQEKLYLPGLDRRTADRIRSIAGHGDERHFARLVADRWKIPLIERQRTTSMDLSRLWQVPLTTSPAMFFTSMEVDDTEIELSQTHGTQAFFSGQAGDAVLLATVQPFPALDYVYLNGIRPDLWKHVVATSALSKESIWNVMGKILKHSVLRRPYNLPLSVLEQPTLMRDEVLETFNADSFKSPWSELTASLPPGKRNHVNGLMGSTYYDFIFHSQQYVDHIDPLNSQPIWELMLRIPTYTILTGGISRGLARSAFADLLPSEVRKRQVKGTGTPFYQQVVRRSRSYLRETLLDGLLVKEGYLDRQKLNNYLTAEEPFVTVRASQILCYLAAEIWLQQWQQSPRKPDVLGQSESSRYAVT